MASCRNRWMGRVGSLGLLVGTLAGCATGAGPVSPAPVPVAEPVHWVHAPATGAVLGPLAASDPTLEALLQRAVERNRDVAQAALRLQQAQVQADLGQLRVTPSAAMSTTLSQPLEAPASAGSARRTGVQLGLGYEADLWGRLAQLRGADAAQLRAAGTDVAAARLAVHTRVAEAYWQLAATGEQQALVQQQQTVAAALLAVTRVRVQEGKLPPIEVDRAAAALQAAETRLADLRADAAQQRLQLGLWLDEPASGLALAGARLPAAEPGPALPTGTPPQVLGRRPDVQRARAQVDAALARLRASEAARYPQLSFSAGLSGGGESIADLLKNPVVSLSANLLVPLIDWHRLERQRDGAKTELELAALQLRETVARAMVDIEGAWLEDDRLRGQLAANAARLHEVREAERLATLRRDIGVLSRLEQLQAVNARLEAEQARLQLRVRAWLQRAQLVRALAGPLSAD